MWVASGIKTKSTGFFCKDKPAYHSQRAPSTEDFPSATSRTGASTLSRLKPGEFFIHNLSPSPNGAAPPFNALKSQAPFGNAISSKYPQPMPSTRLAAANRNFE